MLWDMSITHDPDASRVCTAATDVGAEGPLGGPDCDPEFVGDDQPVVPGGLRVQVVPLLDDY
jgi:hypothetical protein